MLGQNGLQQRESVSDRADGVGSLLGGLLMTLDDGEACEGCGDLPGVPFGAGGGVVLRDLEHRCLIQGEGVRRDISCTDRIAHSLRLANDLPHMPRGNPAGLECGAGEIEVRGQPPSIREGELHRPLRDVSGRRVLRGHRPLNRHPIPGLSAGRFRDAPAWSDGLPRGRVRRAWQRDRGEVCGRRRLSRRSALRRASRASASP